MCVLQVVCREFFFSVCSSEKPYVHNIFLGTAQLAGFLVLVVFAVADWLCKLPQADAAGDLFGKAGLWTGIFSGQMSSIRTFLKKHTTMLVEFFVGEF